MNNIPENILQAAEHINEGYRAMEQKLEEAQAAVAELNQRLIERTRDMLAKQSELIQEARQAKREARDTLAQAVRRMEAVTRDALEDAYFEKASLGAEGVCLPDDHSEALEDVRARLIAAFKGEWQAKPVVVNETPQGDKQPDLSVESERQPLEPAQPTTSPDWTPAVGDAAQSIPEMALGGQMYWRDLALQLASVWWKCHGIGASLQHGDLNKDVAFSIVCERHGGKVFHGDTPDNAWNKAEAWLMSPDRENFPSVRLTPVKP